MSDHTETISAEAEVPAQTTPPDAIDSVGIWAIYQLPAA